MTLPQGKNRQPPGFWFISFISLWCTKIEQIVGKSLGWLKIENTNCFANLLPRSLQQDPGHRWTNLRNGELKDFFCCFMLLPCLQGPSSFGKKRYCWTLLKSMNENQKPRISPDPRCLSQVETSWFGTAGTNFEEHVDFGIVDCCRAIDVLWYFWKKSAHMTSFIVILSLSLSLLFSSAINL